MSERTIRLGGGHEVRSAEGLLHIGERHRVFQQQLVRHVGAVGGLAEVVHVPAAHEPEERVAGVHVGRHSTAAVQAGMLADMAGVHRAQERAATHMAAPKARDGTRAARSSACSLRMMVAFRWAWLLAIFSPMIVR